MTKQEIFDLMDRFEGGTLASMKLSTQEFTIELTRGAPAAPSAPVQSPLPASQAAPAPEADAPAVKAPLVGTFYTAPGPDQAPFVSVGDHVKKGQTVCLIEAMKMMSEIPAPCDCVIGEILKSSGDLVAFGEPLLRYKPC